MFTCQKIYVFNNTNLTTFIFVLHLQKLVLELQHQELYFMSSPICWVLCYSCHPIFFFFVLKSIKLIQISNLSGFSVYFKKDWRIINWMVRVILYQNKNVAHVGIIYALRVHKAHTLFSSQQQSIYLSFLFPMIAVMEGVKIQIGRVLVCTTASHYIPMANSFLWFSIRINDHKAMNNSSKIIKFLT